MIMEIEQNWNIWCFNVTQPLNSSTFIVRSVTMFLFSFSPFTIDSVIFHKNFTN